MTKPRKRMIYACKICGVWVTHAIYCVKCARNLKEYHAPLEPTYLLTSEISGGNVDIRLKYGFNLLRQSEE